MFVCSERFKNEELEQSRLHAGAPPSVKGSEDFLRREGAAPPDLN